MTNNFNQANNFRLWWTLVHGAITICWAGLFYNWGEDGYCAHLGYFPSISRGEMFELPPWNCVMTVKWKPETTAAVCDWISPSEWTGAESRTTSSDLVEFSHLIDWNWEQAPAFREALTAVKRNAETSWPAETASDRLITIRSDLGNKGAADLTFSHWLVMYERCLIKFSCTQQWYYKAPGAPVCLFFSFFGFVSLLLLLCIAVQNLN